MCLVAIQIKMEKKMKKFKDLGIPLDSDILNIIQTGIKIAGGKSKFIKFTDLDFNTLNFYLNKNDDDKDEDDAFKVKRKAQYISWGKWPKIRDYLASVGLLDATDPRWMTPDELRGETPPAFRQEMIVSSPKRFYFDGVPHSEPSSADFLSRLMASEDIPADVKVVIFQEHEKFLSDYGTKRHDSAQHGTLAQFSTGGEETNV